MSTFSRGTRTIPARIFSVWYLVNPRRSQLTRATVSLPLFSTRQRAQSGFADFSVSIGKQRVRLKLDLFGFRPDTLHREPLCGLKGRVFRREISPQVEGDSLAEQPPLKLIQ